MTELFGVLEGYGLSSSAIRTLTEVTTGFSGAGIWKVETDQQQFALRRWPRTGWTAERLLELHRFLIHLSECDIPLAVPVRSFQGETLLSHCGHWWQLEPWLSGEAKQGMELSDSEQVKMMQTLARLHLAAARYIPTRRGAQWFSCRIAPIPAVIERLHLIQQWTPQRIAGVRTSLLTAPEQFRLVGASLLQALEKSGDLVAAELRSLAALEQPTFPCWRDLWSEHVLFQNNNLTGFLDPAATRTDHPGTDLSRLLGSLFGNDAASWEKCLQAYSQVRPLSNTDQLIIRVLDRSSVLLSGLTWLQRWEQNTIAANRLNQVVARLQWIASRQANWL